MQNETYHYFGSSAAEWKTAEDLRDLINWFERSAFPYTLYLVPLDIDADYTIQYYAPRVEGTLCIGNFEPKKENIRRKAA